MNNKSIRGFTMVELMVAMAVMAIVVSLAVPGFQGTTSRTRIAAAAADFLASINYVRSESIRLGRSVTLCKSSDGAGCSDTAEWEQGWIAFVDDNASGDLDTGESLIKVWDGLPSGYTLRGSQHLNRFIRYNPYGSLTNAAGTFVVCHNNKTTGARAVDLTRLRPRLGLDTNGDQIPEKDTLTALSNITSCTNP